MNCERFCLSETAALYTAGKLSGSEREEFELHYFECDKCFDAVRAMRATRSALQADGLEATLASPTPIRSRLPMWTWIAAGVAAALFAGLAVLIRTKSPAFQDSQAAIQVPVAPATADLALLARFDPPPYDPATLRGTESITAKRFRSTMESYRKGEYAGAIGGLRQILDDDPASMNTRFFLGICYLLTGQPDPGIAQLRAVIDNGSASVFLEEAHFYLGKAYLKQGKAGDARAEFEKAAAIHGDLETQSRDILDRLSSK